MTPIARQLARPALFTGVVAALLVMPAAAQDSAVRERIQQCASCHGPDGNSKAKNTPSLAGQPQFFILNQLFLMREGVRRIDVMTRFVKDLKDSDNN